MYHIPKFILSIVLGSVVLVTSITLSVKAADIEVDAGVGEVGCDLIDAINSANGDSAVGGCTAGSGVDTVILATTTYTLTETNNVVTGVYGGPNGLPPITSTITISGNGATIVRASADLFRLFYVGSTGNLTLHNVALHHGYPENNRGGGLFNQQGSVTIIESRIIANVAREAGGGLFNHDGTVTIIESHIVANEAGGAGGGLLNDGGTVTIQNSYILSNTATWGGGLLNQGTGTVTLSNTRVLSNTAINSGGGLHNGGGIFGGDTMMIQNSDILSNTASFGGGLYNALSYAHIQNSHIRANTGGGLVNFDAGATLIVNNSNILSNTTESAGGALFDWLGMSIISESCIVGNSDTAVFSLSTKVAATDNWWGAAEGPSGAGPGGGDSVSDDITFTNFKTTPIRDCPTVTPPDVTLTKASTPDGIWMPRQTVTYTLAFSNTSTGKARNVIITDTLPDQFNFINSTTQSVGAGVSISQTESAPNPVWSVSDLPFGAGGTITLTAQVSDDPSLLGSIVTNTATISSPGDPNTSNNSSSISHSIINPATLVITKVVDGPAPAEDWTIIGSGTIGDFTLPAAGGSKTFMPVLPDTGYTVTESPYPEYTTSVECEDGSSGTISVNLMTPGPDESIGCIFTNTYITQTLTVSKVVEGGPLTAGDFDLFVNGDPVQNGVPTDLTADTYTVTESNVLSYTTDFSGDCGPSGLVKLDIGEHALCVITNTYITQTLTVNKVVDGGSLTVGDFNLFVNDNPVQNDVPTELTAGSYTVTENAEPTYTAAFSGDCDADGVVNLAIGQEALCVITNTYITQTLTVSKVVDGGPFSAGDFDLFVNGNLVQNGVPTELAAGTYTVTESSVPTYTVVFSGDCDASGVVNLAIGQQASCVVTNTYITQTVTVSKVVDGGPLSADDFDLFISGNPVQNGVPTELATGTYTVTESSVPTYTVTFSGDCDASGMVNLSIGQQALCILTNTYSSTAETNSVQGTVIDEEGNGIEGATVVLTDGVESAAVTIVPFEASAVTDADGAFRIDDVPLGEYLLTVTLPGEQEPSHEQTVAVGEGPVMVLDPIAITTKHGIYLPAIQR